MGTSAKILHMERFTLKSAVHLFLIKDDKVLLLRRSNTGYEDGNYSVPAGHLDGNESVTSAMIREAKEEACIVLNPQDLKMAHVMHRTKDDGERIDFFFSSSKWQGEPKIGEPRKCDDLSWFHSGSLPDNVIPYVRFALEQSNKGVVFSEFGWTEEI
jgi:8-oxo-dGTP diphosphatase